MKKYSKLMAILLAVAMLLPGIAQAAPVTEEVNGVEVTRLGGVDRVGTSVLASQEAYEKADAVVLAGFGGDVDALTGTLLAADKKAPLLVTRQFELSDAVKDEIERLGAKTVYILGGEAAVGKEVETALKALDLTVERVEGANRNATAAEVAKEVKGEKADHVFLALGRMPVETDALADALAIGPVSAMKEMPVLLTETNRLPAETIAAMKDLGTTKVTIVGGKSAVSQEIEDMLSDYTVDRVFGDSREKTAVAIAEEYFAAPSNLIVAYGRKSADALVGGYLGAKWNAPILLTNHAGLTAETKAYIQANVLDTYVLGGTSVVPKTAFDQIVEALKGEEAEEELKVESVSAINAKTIEVKFNKAVEDTTKATVELLRGTFKQNVTVNWAEDMKSVQLVGAGNFQAGDYTVKVTGLTDEALTGEVKIEAIKVSSIEILSDEAVLSQNPNGLIDTETATVGYVVKDQYGTDITKTTDLSTNNDNVVITEKGTVTLKGLKGMKIGDLVPVVLVHAQSGTTTSATVKLSAAATVADISVEGVYDAKGKKVELKDNTTAKDVFLVLNLKDQYGNDVKPTGLSQKVNSVIVTNTNPLVAKLVSDKITVKAIDGKNRFVVEFEKLDANNEFKGGSAELLFIKTMDGKTFKYTLNIAETQTTDSVTVVQPQFAISGEDVLLPITVLDKEGNVITDKDLLAHPTKGIKVNGNSANKEKITVKDGQVYYNLDKAGTADNYVTATVTTSTYKVATVTYKVTEAAKPVAVRGFKNPLIIKADDSKTVDFNDIIVEDQYGRTMTQAQFSAATGYDFTLEKITSEDNKVVTVNDKTITAKKTNGTATVTIYLTKTVGEETKAVPNSAVEQQVRVTDGKEYTGYEIAPIGKVQAADVKGSTETPQGTEFTVNGLLNNGKVALDPTTEYTAKVVELADAVDGNKIKINKEKLVDANDKEITEKEFTLRVTINATGKVLEQKFVVSREGKKVQEFFFTEDSDVKTAKEYTKAIEVNDTFTKANLVKVLTTDQYGNKEIIAVPERAVLTIVPADASKVTINNNGKADASATLVGDVEEAELTVTVKIDNATKEIKVNLKKAN